MPKISGTNIVEHIAEQEAAVFEAAIRLFGANGVNNVAMATIADEVGLARTSLYRYFPSKSAIVYRWFDLAITPLIEGSDRIAAAGGTRSERLTRWVECQIDFLIAPGNQAMIRASVESDELGDEQRSAIVARHHDLYVSLLSIITVPDTSVEPTTPARALLIAGLLRSIGDLKTTGIPDELARAELVRAVLLIADLNDG